jgi:sugar lactone lactonase YvrE
MKQQIRFLKIAPALILLLIASITSIGYARPVISQQTVSSSWSAKNIGAAGRKGVLVADGDVLKIWGSGYNIGGTNDQFYYVYSPLSGNGELEAHMMSQDATDGSARAGLMLRETLADNAPNVFLAQTPQHGIALQWRRISGEATRQISGSQGNMPLWMKLVRQGNMVIGWTSYDGSRWLKVQSVAINMSTTVYLGFAITAHNETRLSRVVFMHVHLSETPVSPTPTPSPTPTSTPSPTPSPTPTPSPIPTPAPATSVLQSATRVYGQKDDFTASSVDVNAASLNGPNGVTSDSSGNSYIVDSGNNRVLYYAAGSTTATRVYGQGGSLSSNAVNVGATGLTNPDEAVLDSSGNLYIVDEGNNRVLYYAAGSTTATRVYGQGGSLSSNTDNNGGVSAASLSTPNGVALDTGGNLYIVDALNNRVLYYAAGSTTATRVYGQGGSFTTNANNAGATGLNDPNGVAVDGSGNVYIADTGNNRVLYYPVGSTTATRVYGQRGSFTVNVANNSGVSANSLNAPDGVNVDSSGNLYIADSGNNRVLYYPAGSTTATRVYGQGGSFTTNAHNVGATGLHNPNGAAVDGSGNVYVADMVNNRVLYYPAGSTTATRVYGQGGSFTTNASDVSADSLNNPFGIAVDGSGNVYVADAVNNRVLYYPAGGTTATRVYGQGGDFTSDVANTNVSANSLTGPNGVAVDGSGNLYIADSGNNRVLYYPAGSTTATRVYGQGGDFTANASTVSATGLSIPVGITLDRNGNLYIADAVNNRVLYYPTGSTTATRVYGQGGDFTTNTDEKGGISATSLEHPFGVAVDRSDNLYITDPGNRRILYYAAGSTTATRVYGQGGNFTTNVVDNGGVSATSFFSPLGVVLDSSGNLYTADNENNRAVMLPHT